MARLWVKAPGSIRLAASRLSKNPRRDCPLISRSISTTLSRSGGVSRRIEPVGAARICAFGMMFSLLNGLMRQRFSNTRQTKDLPFRMDELLDHQCHRGNPARDRHDHEDFRKRQLAPREFSDEVRSGNAAESADAEHPGDAGSAALGRIE